MSTKVDQVFELITGMTVLEVNDLKKKFESELGITAAAPMMMAGAMAGGGVAAAVEEQTEFDAILTSSGDKKIQVIKVVRAITGLGLKEAKDLVDSAPKAIKEKVSKAEAMDIKTKIEEAGGVVDVK